MNAIVPDTVKKTFSPELMMRDLMARIMRENKARRQAESAKARRERKRARVLAAANNDPLAQHPRLMKLREELNAQKVA